MTVQTIISGVTFGSSIIKAMPAIPALQTLCFFGSGNDGNNGNRQAGGPALVNIGAGPTYSTNYLTLGGTIGVPNGINTQNNRTAATLSSGFTWMFGVQLPSSGNPSDICSDYSDANNPSATSAIMVSGQQAANAYTLAAGSTTVSITPSTPVTKWHCIGMVNGGGTQPSTSTLYNLTDGQQSSGASHTLLFPTLPLYMSPTLGYSGNAQDGSNYGSSNISFAMVCFAALTLSAMQAIYASVQSILGRRGIIL
jgi:hypothetical protein